MVSKELVDFVRELPGEEGWYKNGDDAYHSACGALLCHGVPIDTIKSILTDLYYATASEFGG